MLGPCGIQVGGHVSEDPADMHAHGKPGLPGAQPRNADVPSEEDLTDNSRKLLLVFSFQCRLEIGTWNEPPSAATSPGPSRGSGSGRQRPRSPDEGSTP